MGKYAALITLAIGLGMTVLATQGMQTDLDTSKDQAARQEKVLAREIANSAFEMGVSELKRDFENWRASRTDVPHEGGSYDLSASGSTNGPVSLVALGHHGGATYKIKGRVTKDTTVSALANAITASIPIDIDVSGGGCSGNPCVSGYDLGGGEDRHGITLPAGSDVEDVCEEFDDKVVGRGKGCDVKSRTEETDDWVERKMNQLDSEIQKAIANGSEDVMVCDTKPHCDISDYPDRSGILYVKSELRYNGEEEWKGLVFVAGGGSVRINGGGSAKNINGGLMLSDSTKFKNDEEFDLNGGNAVHYNSDELKKYMDTLPTLRATTIQVANRTGQFLRSWE